MDVSLIIFIVFFALEFLLFVLGVYVLFFSRQSMEDRLIKAAIFSFLANWLLFYSWIRFEHPENNSQFWM